MLKKIACILFYLVGNLVWCSEDANEIDNANNEYYRLKQKDIEKDILSIVGEKASWIHAIGAITVYFDDGNLNYGFGVLLKDGKFLTSSEILRNYGKYPKKIEVKMQDDSAKPLICIANLQIEKLDNVKGLALLKTQNFTNDYCQERPESFYHKRIYDLFYLNIQANGSLNEGDKIFYPDLSKRYSFEILENNIVSKISFDEMEQKEIVYSINSTKIQKMILGRPFFNENNEFVGMLTVSDHYPKPVVLDREVIINFLNKN